MEVPILEGWEGGGGGGGGVGGLPNTTPAWGLSEIWNEIKSLGHASWGVGEIVLPYESGGGDCAPIWKGQGCSLSHLGM